MLVVLAVLGIVAGLLVANFGRDDRHAAEHEAIRLAGALEHAVATAQWRGETLGISAEGGAYRFWRRDGDARWQVLTGDEVLAPRMLPAGLSMHPASFGGMPVSSDAILPFRPSGRNEPYSLVIAGEHWVATVAGDPLNRVALRIEPEAGNAP